MVLEVSLLVLVVQILSHLRTCFWDPKVCAKQSVSELCTSNEPWIGFSSRNWLQSLKTTLWTLQLRNKYIIPSDSEQPLLKGLRKKYHHLFVFLGSSQEDGDSLSLIFHATIVPHLTAPVSDCWNLPVLFPSISGQSWIQAMVPLAEDKWGKRYLRTSTQNRWLLDGNILGNGLRNVWCLSGTVEECSS